MFLHKLRSRSELTPPPSPVSWVKINFDPETIALFPLFLNSFLFFKLYHHCPKGYNPHPASSKKRHMQLLIDRLTLFNITLGKSTAWLALTMVLMVFINVICRYLFGVSNAWQSELAVFMHAILFLAASGYTLAVDKHVRVDVWYNTLSAKGQARVNIAGVLVFLWPMAGSILCLSSGYVSSSWQLLEGSAETDGMPGVFLLKSCILLFAFSIALQGAAILLRSIRELRC